MEQDQFKQFDYFASSIYRLDKPEFLDIVNEVSNEYLEKSKKEEPNLDKIHPVRMTSHYFNDERIKDFASYVAQTSWNILQHQGYAMKDNQTFFLEMWTQEHHKSSDMHPHIHGNNTQIVAFYFLDTPKDSSKLVFHDSRLAKVISNLPEENVNNATIASSMVNFTPEAGMLLLTNSYIPHSFSRHKSKEPLKFIHMSLGVSHIQNNHKPEIV
jgi:hypothetical protein